MELLAFAAQGYIVAQVNPHISVKYGLKFGEHVSCMSMKNNSNGWRGGWNKDCIVA